MLSLSLLSALVVVAGLIAYLGNLVGRRIGRSRLTFSKLRPRYTANLITVLTGALIAVFTFAFLMLVSSDFRTAFFDWEKLVQARQKLTAELDSRNKELQDLQKKIASLDAQAQSGAAKVAELSQSKTALEQDISRLKEVAAALLASVQSVRSGQVIYKVNEPILVAVIRGGQSPKDSAEALKNLLSRADSQVRLKSQEAAVSVPEGKPLLWLSAQELDEAAAYLAAHDEEVGVKVASAHNAVAGEVVVVHLELFANKLIYKNGDVLGQIELAANQNQRELENQIFNLLYQIGQTARSKGVMADANGLVGSTPYSRVYQIIERVKRSRSLKQIKVEAARDIYTIGPLEVEFVFDQPER